MQSHEFQNKITILYYYNCLEAEKKKKKNLKMQRLHLILFT